MMSNLSIPCTALFSMASGLLRATGDFAEVIESSADVHCTDPIQPEAAFRLTFDDGKLWASWVSPNRYLSQSIEADVKWTGDDIDDLIDEEVEALGWTGPKIGRFQHFRSQDMQYTFRSALPLDLSAGSTESNGRAAVLFLRAYQAAFRNLGDMKPEEE